MKALLKKHNTQSGMRKNIWLSIFSILIIAPTLALAQTPPLPPTNTVGTPIDPSKPIELKMELPTPPEGQPAPQTTTEQQIDISTLPGAPAFLKDIKTKEQYDALTEAQKKEAETFFQTIQGPGAPAGSEQSSLPNTVNCFDYYHFGSIQVDLSNTTGSAVTGTDTTFSGIIINNNTYPVVDGAIYAKVFRLPVVGGTPVQGYDVVDQFFVQEHIDLPANAEVPASFTWKVPTHLAGGEYQIAFFYTSAKKFNLLGLSFTDDVVGNTNSFSVGSELTTRVYFDKEKVTVDGQKYFFAAFTPKLSNSKPITAETTLTNETDSAQNVSVLWKVYKWDAQTEDNKLEEKTETISIPANSSLPLSHTVSDTSGSVYLVIAEAQYEDAKSILNIRFTRESVPTTRINFPALTSYPLVANQETTLFSCLHSTGTLDLVEDGKLVLTLTDKQGNVIHTYTYEGGVTGNMMAVKDAFTPKKNYDTVTLKAELYNSNKIVDTAEMHYDCKTLNNGTCAPDEKETITSFFGEGNTPSMTTGSIVVLLLLILLLAFLIWKRKQTNTATMYNSTTSTTPTKSNASNKTIVSILIGITFLSGGLLGAGEVEAAITVPGDEYMCNTDDDTQYYNSHSGMFTSFVVSLDKSDANYTPGSTMYINVVDVGTTESPTVLGTTPNSVSGISGWITARPSRGVGAVALTVPSTAGSYRAYAMIQPDGFGLPQTCIADGETGSVSCSHVCYASNVVTSIAYTVCPSGQSWNGTNCVTPNTLPNAPTITGLGGVTGQNLTFTFSGTDPDGDQVKYGIDWDNNGSVDTWTPASGLVNSGTAQTANKSWATVGSKTFQALTQDSKTGQSTWTSHIVTITPRVWTTYCSGAGNTPSTNNWQWWQYSDDSAGRSYRFLRAGDGICTPCIDPVPPLNFAHATLCSAGLGVATKTIVNSCTGARCEYVCETGYAKSNNTGVCVPVPVIKSFETTVNGVASLAATDGDTVNFLWTADNADTCSITGQGFTNHSGGRNGSANGKIAGALSPKVKGPYTLTCKRNDLPNNSATRPLNLNVNCTLGPISGVGWSSCPVCDQEGDATQSRTVVTSASTCATGTESKLCSVPKCKPGGFQEVAP